MTDGAGPAERVTPAPHATPTAPHAAPTRHATPTAPHAAPTRHATPAAPHATSAQPTPPHGATPLRTGSLRRRVIVAGTLVILVVLVLLGVATDVLFAAQTRRDTDMRLRERATLAEQLTRDGIGPRVLVRRVGAGGVDARLTLPDGTELGDAELPAGAAGAATRRGGVRRVDGATVLERTLSDGSRLLLVADSGQAAAAQLRLRRLLVLVGLAALVMATIALVAVVRVALAPLDAMTAVASSIARGDRGRRLVPTRRDTELGRAAAAFDDMVAALEGAEHAARASEQRTRQFVADAAHELRTPLAGVQAAVEASVQAGRAGTGAGGGVDRDGSSGDGTGNGDRDDRDGDDRDGDDRDGDDRDGDAATAERLQVLAVREARRATRLVEDLLLLARIDAGLDLRPRRADLAALAEAEAERARLLSPSLTITVARDAHEPPAPVLADPERVAQVLANLVDNARRHTPDGGAVTLVARGSALLVADTGPGVPADARTRIFDRLVRLDAARAADTGGAGLGLAIARGIARASGGDLRCVEPPDGTGALFVLTLPPA